LAGLIRRRDEWQAEDGYQPSHDLLGYLQFEHTIDFELRTLDAFARRAGLMRVEGDEIVRALYAAAEGAEGDAEGPADELRGAAVVARLAAVERDWAEDNPAWKQALRPLVQRLRQVRGKASA